MANPIPPFYRHFFTTFDAIGALTGVLGNFFTPAPILDSYNPNAQIPPSLETRLLLDSSAGFLLGTMFLQTVLLRLRPRDLTVWRCVQTMIGIVDVVLLGSFTRTLNEQGRLNPGMWRGMEWMNMLFTAFVLSIRVAFLLGVGVGGGVKAKDA